MIEWYWKIFLHGLTIDLKIVVGFSHLLLGIQCSFLIRRNFGVW